MADILSTLRGWSATASSNLPSGGTTIGTNLDDNLREIQAVVRGYLAGEASNMASASTVDLSTATSNYINVTGTTTITSLGTESAGMQYLLKFAGILTLTHNATSLILPWGANLTTYAGALALFVSEGSGNWRCLWFSREPEQLLVPITDQTTAITSGAAKYVFRMPAAMVVMSVRASLVTAQTGNGAGGIFTVDINESGVSILSTKLTIDNNEKTSVTAATPAVISDNYLADDAEISVDVDQVGDGTAKGLFICLIGFLQ